MPDPSDPTSPATPPAPADAGRVRRRRRVRRDFEPPDEVPPATSTRCRRALSLGRRLRQTKTIVSILVPLAIIAVFVGLNRESLSKVPGLIAGANPLLLLVAFLVFYLGFPLRGKRWAMLLAEPASGSGVKDSTEILYLSWLVNCLVPAKLGDVYRAYLLRINSDGLAEPRRSAPCSSSASSTSSRSPCWASRPASGASGAACRRRSRSSFGLGVVVVDRARPRRCSRSATSGGGSSSRCRLPDRIIEFYDRFEEGVFGAVSRRQLPALVAARRRDLDDRVAAPVLRRQGVRVPRRRASASPARCSSRSSARC